MKRASVPLSRSRPGNVVRLNRPLIRVLRTPLLPRGEKGAVAGRKRGVQGSSPAQRGRGTTRSVVEGIFLVIVADALFSILFSILDL